MYTAFHARLLTCIELREMVWLKSMVRTLKMKEEQAFEVLTTMSGAFGSTGGRPPPAFMEWRAWILELPRSSCLGLISEYPLPFVFALNLTCSRIEEGERETREEDP